MIKLNIGKGKAGIWKFIFFSIIICVMLAIIVPLILEFTIPYEILRKYNILISAILEIVIIGGSVKLISSKQKLDFSFSSIKSAFKDMLSLKGILSVLFVSVFAFLVSRTLADGIKWIYIGITDDFSIYSAPDSLKWYIFLILIVFVSVIPAIFEEAFYRAISYNYLKEYNYFVILLVSTLSFSLAHIQSGWDTVITAAVFGSLVMLQYIKNQNYVAAAIAHFLFNTINLLFSYIITWFTDCSYIPSRASSGAECIFWGLVYISGAIFICILPLLYSAIKQVRHNI